MFSPMALVRRPKAPRRLARRASRWAHVVGSGFALASGLALGLGAIGFAGCVPIDGGAFEAVWVLFDDQGRAISDCTCSDPPIAQVAFRIVGTGRNGSVAGALPCAGRDACVFACHRQTGATPFDIPPGEYAFTLEARDASGASLTGSACTGDAGMSASVESVVPRCVDAPAQILRQVVRGQATDVNALPLATHCSESCSGTSSGGVCAHP